MEALMARQCLRPIEILIRREAQRDPLFVSLWICVCRCVVSASNGQRNMKRASNCCIVSKHSLLKRLNWEGWWAVLCCQTTVQMTASRATATHSLEHTVWKALLWGFPEYNWLKPGFAVLCYGVVCAEKAIFHKWLTNMMWNIQDYTTVLLVWRGARMCVC